jgi:predicted esterase
VAETTRIERPPRSREEVPVQLSRLIDAHQVIIRQVRLLGRRAVQFGDDGTNDLAVSEVLRTAARLDPLIPSGQAEELAALFKSGGADVTISWHQGGRELDEEDIQAANHWLSRESIRRKVAA